MNENIGCALFCFGLICCIIGATFANKTRDKHPQAIEVYQGKTTLEYKIVDGEIVDSCVIYKNK